ncbi:hypothetical protein D3C71_808360 [compost metagenome]
MVGEARIGFNQIVAAVAVDVEQAGRGCTGVRRAHRDAVRRAAGGGNHARPGCGAVAGYSAHRATLLRASGVGRLRQRALRTCSTCMARPLCTTVARAVRQRLRPLHVEVGHCRAILHVGRVAPLIEVTQIADVDGERAVGSDLPTQLADLFGDGCCFPLRAGAVVGNRCVVERMRSKQLHAFIAHTAVRAVANDLHVAAGSDLRIEVVQLIYRKAHVATRSNDRIGADARLELVLVGDMVRQAVLLVEAGFLGVLAPPEDRRVRIVETGGGDELDAAGAARSVRIGEGQTVGLVGELLLGLEHIEGVATCHLVRIGGSTLADVVDRDRPVHRVHAPALATHVIAQAAGAEEEARGVRSQADHRPAQPGAVGSNEGLVLQHVFRRDVVELPCFVIAGVADRSRRVLAVLLPRRNRHARGGVDRLCRNDRHVLTDVVDHTRIDRQVAADINDRTDVVDPAGRARSNAVSPQRSADGRIAAAVDQALAGVLQFAHAQVQALARGHGADAGGTVGILGMVLQHAGGDRHVVAIDAAGAEVVQHVGFKVGHLAVDQAAIGQLAAGIEMGNAFAGDLAVGSIGDVLRVEVEVAAAQHALVVQVAGQMQGQRAVGNPFAAVAQALLQGQAQVALGMHLTVLAKCTRHQGLAAIGPQQAATVGNAVGTAVEVAAGGDDTPVVLQLAVDLQPRATVGDDLALAVVQPLRSKLQLARLQAAGTIAAAGITVVDAGCGEGQQLAGGDRAGRAVQVPAEGQVEIAPGLHAPGAVGQRRRLQRQARRAGKRTAGAVVGTGQQQARIALCVQRATAVVQRTTVQL